MLINLKPPGARGSSFAAILERLRKEGNSVAGVGLYLQPVQDLTIDSSSGRTQYQFALQGSDSAAVAEWSARLTRRLAQDPKVRNVVSDLQNQGLAAFVDIDRDTAARLGITPATVDDTLYSAFGQRIISTIFTQSSQERVIIQADPNIPRTLESLNNLYLASAAGSPIPLSAIATITPRASPLQVNHVGQFPAANIGFDTAPGVSLGAAVAAIQKDEKAIGIPATITTAFLGAANAFQSSLGNELWLILAAIVTVYIVLGVLYESYIHPITILSTLPSAGPARSSP